MSADADWLVSKVLDFLAVLHKCFMETTYSEDRSLYAMDIAAATGWLVRLHQGESIDGVVAQILDSSTNKQFTDYWRKGKWGELESRGLSELQQELTRVLKPQDGSGIT
jgi:hypothetical protein